MSETDHDTLTPEQTCQIEAAEHVLGVHGAAERAAFVQRLEDEQDLSNDLTFWETRLGGLVGSVKLVAPPDGWAKIEGQLGAVTAAARKAAAEAEARKVAAAKAEAAARKAAEAAAEAARKQAAAEEEARKIAVAKAEAAARKAAEAAAEAARKQAAAEAEAQKVAAAKAEVAARKAAEAAAETARRQAASAAEAAAQKEAEAAAATQKPTVTAMQPQSAAGAIADAPRAASPSSSVAPPPPAAAPSPMAAPPKAAAPPPHRAAPARTAPPPRTGLWRSVGFWRAFGLAAAVVAAGGIAGMVYISRLPPKGFHKPLLATLGQTNGQPGFVAAVGADGQSLTIVPVGQLTPDQRSMELWLITSGNRAYSLGLIAAGRTVRLTIPPALLQHVGANASLSVSLEPPAGSAGGQPTGPVIANGPLTNL